MCGLNRDITKYYDLHNMRYHLDVLETFLQQPSNSKARGYLTSPVDDSITKL